MIKKYTYLGLCLLGFGLIIPQIFAGYSWKPVEIARVVTANFFINNDEEKMRIIGILPNDEFAPDNKKSCHAKGNFRDIKHLLLNNEIQTATDEKVIDAVHLKIDTDYVTEIILRNGWATMNDDDVSSFFASRFKKAQQSAQDDKRGLWAPCFLEKNRKKIRDNYGERMRNFKKNNVQFMGDVAVGMVQSVISGNEIVLRNGPTVYLNDIEISEGTDQASVCFNEQSKNYLENLILNKKIRIEQQTNGENIRNYRLVRNIYLNENSREISLNHQMIRDGFGKYTGKDVELVTLQNEVYTNPRGAWAICAREILNTDFSDTTENVRQIDPDCPIKGNISGTKKLPIKTYHTVLSGWYERIQSEQCFQTEDEADVAGFRKIK